MVREISARWPGCLKKPKLSIEDDRSGGPSVGFSLCRMPSLSRDLERTSWDVVIAPLDDEGVFATVLDDITNHRRLKNFSDDPN